MTSKKIVVGFGIGLGIFDLSLDLVLGAGWKVENVEC
jgi:hypothetical protein